MWKLLSKITKNLILSIPVMMIAGFLFGLMVNASFLKSFIIPFTFIMVYPMMVNLNIQKVFEGGDTKAQLLTQVINFGIIPFFTYGVGLIFFSNNPYMALGLLLAGLVPTSGMTISWTGFARGNLEAVVKMTVIGLTIGSIATPFYVKFLMGAAIEVDFIRVMQQIVIIVFVPMAAGFFTRKALVAKYGFKEFKQNIGPKFPAISTLGVIGIVFIAMALKAKSIAATPQMLVVILIPLAIIYLVNFVLSTLVGKWFLPRGDAIALVYGSVMRNLSIALAIAINAFGKEGASAALVVAIAYIIQVQSAAWYVKFTDRLFGKPEPLPDQDEKADKEAVSLKPDAALSGTMVPDIRNILFATDLSDTARFAARYACSIGNRYGAEVTVIHVVHDALEDLSPGAGMDLSEKISDDDRNLFNREAVDNAVELMHERIRKTSARVREEIPQCPINESASIVKVGDPVDTIVDAADQGNFDLIIMGTHGHGEFDDMLLGSTTQGVIRKAGVPVLVAKPQ